MITAAQFALSKSPTDWIRTSAAELTWTT